MQWYKRVTGDSQVKPSQSGQAAPDSKPVADPVGWDRDASRRRIYVKVDMEGISGIVSPDQLRPGSPEHEEARRLLMHDLNAVLEGAFAGGCREAIIHDVHEAGRNIHLDSLDPRASVISGKPLPKEGFFYGLDDTFHALFLVGYHARAGAQDALMPHTYDEDIAAIRVNETEVGEIGLEAALAGKFGVPLAFVSADSGGVREARELLGKDIEAVEVKRALSPTSGICLPASRTAEMLREAAARAMRNAPRVPPVVFQSPTTFEVTFTKPESALALEQMPGIERTGQNTICTQGPSILAAYRTFVLARQHNGTS